jgi:hypothetical protein
MVAKRMPLSSTAYSPCPVSSSMHWFHAARRGAKQGKSSCLYGFEGNVFSACPGRALQPSAGLA